MLVGTRAKLALSVSLLLLSVAAPAEEVKIYRDTWGVPHIYADSDAAAAFGIGYAQAEDRLEDIYKNVRTALGRMSEAFGADHVQTDYAMGLVRNAELCEQEFANAPEPLQVLARNYVAGVKTFVAEHPERVPEYALDLEPWHCAAIGRTMILRWPLGTLFGELGKKPKKPDFSSNCFAVAPERSADGSAILLTDPHLTWESLAVFWEGRVHAPDLDMCGFFIVGSPLVGLGHNGHVGWAMTTGGTDTSDVYMLKFKMGFPPQYEYDGEWRIPKLVPIRINVKGEEKPRVMPSLQTHLGPLLAEPDTENGVAYAGRTPYIDDVGVFEQMYRMVKARSADEFYEALRMNHLMEQNIMYADRAGTIGYARVGRTPIRPEGYDWSKPVPGHTSATDWQGIHDVNDHVRIVNPPQGYMQNCNISPANMMEDSPLTPDKYRDYLYNVSWDDNNPRGKRMVQLLAADESITREEATAITLDVYDILAEPWKNALRTALSGADAANFTAEFQSAVDTILAWDGQFTKDSKAAPLVWQWRMQSKDVDTGALAEGRTLTAEGNAALLSALEKGLEVLRESFGKTDLTWGDTHVNGRNGEYFPYDGADFGRGAAFTETLRDVEADRKEEGRYVATGGCMSTMLMFFKPDGVTAFTATPWGQSGVPGSAHHVDQARDLFSKRELKPTWFDKVELMEHVASEKVLTLP